MDPVLLKIAFSVTLCLNSYTWIESVPLTKQSRLSLAEWTNYNAFEPQGTGTYAFGYDVEDPETDNIQYRDEERHPNGTVTGSYGYLRPDGTIHIAHYVADENGYRVTIENIPRGQLKPNGNNDGTLTPEASYIMSPALTSALQSLRVYKKQKVHEQRTRPVDMFPKRNSRRTQSYSFNGNQMYNTYSSDFHERSDIENNFFNDYSYYDPYRFFVNRK